MPDYSSTPLARKLGIKPGSRLVVLDPPEDFAGRLEPLPGDVSVSRGLADGDADVVVLFCRSACELNEGLAAVARRLAPAGGLWVAWPKKASGVKTDLDFDGVQRAGLALGLVDNKVCAVDDIYSGLRFVVRREDREAWSAGRRV